MKATAAFVVVAAAVTACATAYNKPSLSPVSGVSDTLKSNRLKVHMRNGELYMLTDWHVDATRTIRGSGTRHDVWREKADSAVDVAIPADSAALIETNSKEIAVNLGHVLIGAIVVSEAYFVALCLQDPKICFGSCPTFYVDGDEPDRVRAEGFSESVARVLERRDVDALALTGVRGQRLTLRMRNEAMETHMVRQVHLLAVERPANARVFAIGDTGFVAVRDIAAASTCESGGGDCRRLLAERDNNEWVSRADSNDLATREFIELNFDRVPGQPALVLTTRKSLVTTFLFYQTLAWLGRGASDLLAQMERGTRQQAEDHFAMARLLGDVEIQVATDTGWTTVGTAGEAGPIAADTKVIPLPREAFRADGGARVRLRMARGNWRLDWVALGSLGERVQVQRLAPESVARNGTVDPTALATLTTGASHIVALPGDEYAMQFALPLEASALDLFVESEGFYYEWMRREWLAEENLPMAAQALADPAGTLRRLAPAFSAREATMEKVFWDSRYNRRASHER